ncbi:MAG: PKD domain-containing protein, partial [Bacteroidetes bacterium]|nr:PKD domain-containing protein [Bacteroidota bacterium]
IDSVIKNVVVDSLPVAEFTFDTVCLNELTHFYDQSQWHGSANNSWTYYFGDASSANGKNVSHTYASPSSFTASLVVTNVNGCKDSIAHTIKVDPLPQPNFSFNQACLNDTTFFNDLSSGSGVGITSYNWDFDDGSSDTNTNPFHVYQSAGTYDVSLVISNANGCIDTVTKSVIVNPLPTANFSYTNACLGETTQFTDNSSGSGASLNNWSWSFGDSTSSTSQSPSHMYSASGSYSVKLIVTNTNGCIDSVIKNVVVDSLPVAEFTFDTVCLNELTHFYDQSQWHGSANISWKYYFGDGDSSAIHSPTHTYQNPSVFTVVLFVSNTQGCMDSISHEVKIDSLPYPDFSFNRACFYDTTYFNDLSAGSGATISTYIWDFGDSNSSSLQNPRHVYQNPGTYNVTLKVGNSKNCSDSITYSIKVDSLPVADFSFSHACLGQTTQFVDLSSGPDTNLINWNWDFGDASSSTTQNPNHLFNTPIPFNVSLIVSNANGCLDTVVKTIVIDSLPVAEFTFDTVCLNELTHFYDLSESHGSTNNIWKYYFGDANTSTSQNPTHTYSNPTFYNVSLVVTNVNGCSDSVAHIIKIDSLPEPDFTFTRVCFNDTTFFTDVSSGAGVNVIGYEWDFGDAYISTSPNPWHVYQNPGTYNVSLRITNSNNCSDSIMYSIKVDSLPVADFSFSHACLGQTTQFVDLSSGPDTNLTNWNWDFGDASSSTTQNPNHLFNTPIPFEVSLIVSNANGCLDTVVKTIVIDSLPVAEFTFDTVCLNELTHFYDLSESHGSTNNDWKYYFGDAASSTSQNPTHIYTNPTYYNASLVVTNVNGCSDSTSNIIKVDSLPIPDFVFNNVCLQDTTQFLDKSTGEGVPILIYYWNFGDGSNSFDQNPKHYYQNPGTYIVTLRIVNSNGCFDSITKTINIYPLPIASFSFDTISCVLQSIPFINSSIGGSSYYWNFGDGNIASSNTSNPNTSHTYIDTGFYFITLIATTAYGCKDTLIKQIEVIQEPDAKFTMNPDSGCAPLDVNYSNLSKGKYVSYVWDFGNGTTSTLENPPTITYHAAKYGNKLYFVTLTVKNKCDSSVFKDTVIVLPVPVAVFDLEPKIGCEPLLVTLRNKSYGLPLSNVWDLGDGNTYKQIGKKDSVIQHTYVTGENDTTYYIKLIVKNKCGIDSLVKNVIVKPNTLGAFFTKNKNRICKGDTIKLKDGHAGIGSITWYMGDGNIYKDTSYITHVYSDTGTFFIKQVIDNGCAKDSFSSPVIVEGLPVVMFTIDKDNKCINLPVYFENTSKDISGSSWRFGDGDSSIMTNPSHTYDSSGIFLVTLKVYSNSFLQCPNSLSKPVNILPPPIVEVEYLPDYGCVPLTIQIINNSTNAEFFKWQLGNGENITGKSPKLYFDKSGEYVLTVIAESKDHCFDSAEKRINVYPNPISEFEIFYDKTTLPWTEFINQSKGADSYEWYWDNFMQSVSTNQTAYFRDIVNKPITLVAKTKYNCYDTVIHMISEYYHGLYVPNAFAPELYPSDSFTRFQASAIGLRYYKLRIFNTHGTMVYSWERNFEDYEDGIPEFFLGWDGTIFNQGEVKCPSDVYVWKIEAVFKNGEPWIGREYKGLYYQSGYLMLIR